MAHSLRKGKGTGTEAINLTRLLWLDGRRLEGRLFGELGDGDGVGMVTAGVTCTLVTCRYMMQAERKHMLKTRRTSTTVPLGGDTWRVSG